jgi:hypothetical protein
MTNYPLESNYPINNLTVAELETLITKIVQKVIREESQKPSKTENSEEELANHGQIPRPYGLWKGQVQMSDDFDILPDAIAAAFAGERE